MILVDEMIINEIYECDARNFSIGRWTGEGIEGIRDKFGSRYLFTETHYNLGGRSHHGSAVPMRVASEKEKADFLKAVKAL